MEWFTIVLFLVYTYGLGFTATSFVKNSENFLERTIMRVGVGLAVLPLVAIALNLLTIPTHWWLVLIISIACPIYYNIRHPPKIKIHITKSDLYIIGALLLFAINLFVYTKGAFIYPYLEDSDPYNHVLGVEFMEHEKNVFADGAEFIRYMNPYHPAYNIILGITAQTTTSNQWNLKFFNALIISLSTLFFYFFVRQLSGVRLKALLATAFLVAIPSFMSHFIWAISLAMPLYFVSFYCFERLKEHKHWWIPTGLVMAGASLCTPTHSTYFVLLAGLYVIVRIIIEKKLFPDIIKSSLLGAGLSFALWWIPMIVTYGSVQEVLNRFSLGNGRDVLSVGGTGDAAYTLDRFIVAPMGNLINNPVGIGVTISALFALGLCFILFLERDKIKKYALHLVGVAVTGIVVSTTFLYSTYRRELWVDEEYLANLNISFGEFMSEQFFVIFFVGLFTALALCYAYMQWREGLSQPYRIIVLFFLAFIFYAVNSAPYHIKLSPFRTWMILAIPVCIIAAEGAYYLHSMISKIGGKVAGIVLLAVLFFGIPSLSADPLDKPYVKGVYQTSFIQKYAVNTAQWQPGGFWTSGEEIGMYVWMRDNLPKNSKVFTFEHNAGIVAFDMFTCHWCPEVTAYMKEAGFNQTAEHNLNWLRENEYDYVIIDGQTARRHGQNKTNEKIQGFAQLGLQPVSPQNNGAIIFKV